MKNYHDLFNLEDGEYWLRKRVLFFFKASLGYLYVTTNKSGCKIVHWTSHGETHCPSWGPSILLDFDADGLLNIVWKSAIGMHVVWSNYRNSAEDNKEGQKLVDKIKNLFDNADFVDKIR